MLKKLNLDLTWKKRCIHFIYLFFTGPPEPPTQVILSVSSNSSLHVTFDEPLNHNGAVVTKYKGIKSTEIQTL